jgi:hypothetical protein
MFKLQAEGTLLTTIYHDAESSYNHFGNATIGDADMLLVTSTVPLNYAFP